MKVLLDDILNVNREFLVLSLISRDLPGLYRRPKNARCENLAVNFRLYATLSLNRRRIISLNLYNSFYNSFIYISSPSLKQRFVVM
jgi:hypothetical protein